MYSLIYRLFTAITSFFRCFSVTRYDVRQTSSSTLTNSYVAGMFGPKTILGTTIKLNVSSYMVWAQAFRIFISSQNKLAPVLEPPPPTTVTTYETWLFGNYCVMTCLLNNLEEKISSGVMFISTMKKM